MRTLNNETPKPKTASSKHILNSKCFAQPQPESLKPKPAEP